jgi:hypothetical protein
MTNDDLQERIENSPALQKLKDQLQAEIGFRAEKTVEFSPLLVISVISIIVQIVIHCRESKSADDIRNDMRELRSLPPLPASRLRRKLNALWRRACGGKTLQSENPLIDAVYELSDSADDDALDELLWLADMNRPPEK